MDYEDIIKRLVEEKLINEDGKISPWLDRKISAKLKDDVIIATTFLQYDVPKLFHRIRTIQLQIKSQPICKRDGCNNPTKYEASKFTFLEYCSVECANECDKVKDKRTNTNMDLFGVKCRIQLISPEIRSDNSRKASVLARDAILEKYGVANVMFVEEIKNKHADIMGSYEIKQKKYETVIQNYGSYSNLLDVRDQKLGWGIYNTDAKSKKDYKSRATYFTKTQDISQLQHIGYRGRANIKGAFHLDHKFSISNGFENNIHPSVIGSIHNLEFIPAIDNIKKQTKNSIELGTLLALIETDGINITLEQFKQLSGV